MDNVLFLCEMKLDEQDKRHLKRIGCLLLSSLFLLSLFTIPLSDVHKHPTLYMIGDYSFAIFFLYFLKQYFKN